jgi:FAD/FMN-containing dehydrogenase
MREFVPAFLVQHENGAVVRISCKLTEIGPVLESLPGPAIARAGSGIVYACFSDATEAIGRGVIEFAPQKFRETQQLWPAPGDDFAMMKNIKGMLDPHGLLNAGRLYGRI